MSPGAWQGVDMNRAEVGADERPSTGEEGQGLLTVMPTKSSKGLVEACSQCHSESKDGSMMPQQPPAVGEEAMRPSPSGEERSGGEAGLRPCQESAS